MDGGARRYAPWTAHKSRFRPATRNYKHNSYSILAAQRSTRGKLCVPVGQPGLTSLHKTRKNHHMYFKGIAKKIYHFVQNHIFNRKIHIKIIENTVLLP